MREGGSSVQSVVRAISLLEILSETGGELGVSDLGRRLGVHKATASRLLATLASRGLVERDPLTDRYRLGFGLARLARAAATNLDVARQARPILVGLAEQTGETVNLALLDGDQVVNIDQAASTRFVATVNWVGRRTPLHCTANGKVLLAHLDERDRDRILAGSLERLTRRTVVDPVRLRRELAEARRRGYAVAVEELEEGLVAVGAPVRNAEGEVIAAVSVAGPVYRMNRSRLSLLGQMTREAGLDLSRRMGYAEPTMVAGRR